MQINYITTRPCIEGQAVAVSERMPDIVALQDDAEFNRAMACCPRRIGRDALARQLHLVERHHNEHFRELIDEVMPTCRARREELNRAPLAHEEWKY